MVVRTTASGLLVALPRDLQTATLSNCGDILKLQSAKPLPETGRWPGRETPGTATTSADVTMDNPQPSPVGSFASPTDAVHRLNGSGLVDHTTGLRYSRPPVERPACWRMELGPESQQEGWVKYLVPMWTKGVLLAVESLHPWIRGSLRLNLTQHGKTYQVQT